MSLQKVDWDKLTEEGKLRFFTESKKQFKKTCILFLIFSIICFVFALACILFMMSGLVQDSGSVLQETVAGAEEESVQSPDTVLLFMAGMFHFGAGFVVLLIFFVKKYKVYKNNFTDIQTFATWYCSVRDRELGEELEKEKEKLRESNAGKWGFWMKHCVEMEHFHASKDFGKYIKFDMAQKLWCIPTDVKKDKTHIRLYHFSDIVEVHLMADNDEVIINEKSKGAAIAGGLLFGGVGAVAGAMAGNSNSRVSSILTMLQIEITVKDDHDPVRIVELIRGEVEKTDSDYREKYNLALEIMTFLTRICEANQKEQGVTRLEKIDASLRNGEYNNDFMNEVKKYKELKDSGIITEEEFNLKKKQLLGL